MFFHDLSSIYLRGNKVSEAIKKGGVEILFVLASSTTTQFRLDIDMAWVCSI